ncbi:MAG: preprotein translocase subunit YajC [Proteobacteria bacterium]|jgi:preprotein translocase subunit YajC|nr:preprotein translocase subunit YajC [Pseudomonadota bacterium]MCG6934610.1 preprotein translocase subunit YajC [Pseudomonadota bacterium]
MSFLISDAYAEAAPAAQQSDPITSLIFFGGFILIFYFILIRPQQKRAKEHRNLVAALSKGDEVVTNGGLLGKITDVSEEYLSVELADNVIVRVQKQAVASVLPKGSLKAAGKEK